MTTAPIAYLASEYPALSHTFVLREIAALRADGRKVLTCSLKRTSGAHVAGPAEAAEAARTFYVADTLTRPGDSLAALVRALARPGRLARALRLAWETRVPGVEGALRRLLHLAEAMVLARHLEDRGVVHLHVHFANAGTTVAMMASALSGIPYSFTLHGPSIFFEPRAQALGRKIAGAAFVACISRFCRSQGMIFANPADWPKMRIVHCGVEPDRYRRSEEAGHAKRLVFVGRLAAVKGVAVLLEAIAALKAGHPDIALTLIGDGDERPALEERARALGLGDAVTFAGARTQDEVAAALSIADLFVLPSFAEGVPVVLMEAMASGLPVVATGIAGIAELVDDGVSGRLVSPGDAEALAAAIGELLAKGADERTEMGRVGRVRIEAEFDVRTEARKIAALIDEPSGLGDTL